MPDGRVLLFALQRGSRERFRPADELRLGRVSGLLARAAEGFALRRTGRQGARGHLLFDAQGRVLQAEAGPLGNASGRELAALRDEVERLLHGADPGPRCYPLGGLDLVLVPQVAGARVRVVVEVFEAGSAPPETLARRYGLTPTETRVAQLLAREGLGNRLLAERLGKSERVIRAYLENLSRKTGAQGRRHLRELLRQVPVEPMAPVELADLGVPEEIAARTPDARRAE